MVKLSENNNIERIPQINVIDLHKELYFCTKCFSSVEINYSNEKEGIIESRCVNNINHIFRINIADYIQKIEDNIKKGLCSEICQNHKPHENKYLSHCLDCNKHLCEECLNSGEHIHHKTINISEVQSKEETLNILKLIIEDKKNEIKNIEIEKNKMINEINNNLNNELKNEKIKSKKRIISYKEEEEIEIKKIEEKCINKINELEKEFNQKLKELRAQHKKEKNKVLNKYNLKLKSEEIYIKNKLQSINEKFEKEKNNLNYDIEIKMKNIKNLNRLNELVYGTYKEHKNNFYNAVNVNNIIYYYSQNNDIRNNITKNILKYNFEELLKGVKIKYENLKKVIQKFYKEKEMENKANDILKKALKEKEDKEKILENIKNFEEKDFDRVKSIFLF